MATDQRVGYPTQPTTQQRPLTTQLREAGETILETVLKPTTIEIRPRCQPDGEWFQSEDGMTRKTWARRRSAFDDRVQLTTGSLGGTWRLEHQREDGTLDIVARGLEREQAYKRAERYMADQSGVGEHSRTGRAAEVDK